MKRQLSCKPKKNKDQIAESKSHFKRERVEDRVCLGIRWYNQHVVILWDPTGSFCSGVGRRTGCV